MDMDTKAPILAEIAADRWPDWSSIIDEIHCPLCEYNLRGLSEPRCPECGYRFAWAEVLDPSRRNHSFLFEHHPRTWYTSFWKTLWAGWRPRLFWTTLHPTQRSYPYRLAVYYLLPSCAG